MARHRERNCSGDNIKMDVKETNLRFGDERLMKLAEDCMHWSYLVTEMLNIWVMLPRCYFVFTSWKREVHEKAVVAQTVTVIFALCGSLLPCPQGPALRSKRQFNSVQDVLFCLSKNQLNVANS
jgi:hypothetical protein